MPTPRVESPPRPWPLVVQVGFIDGARATEAADGAALAAALQALLAALPQQAGLLPQHVLCGVSTALSAADACFAQACAALGLMHRVVLTGAEGEAAASVVSYKPLHTSDDEHERREDARLEIVHAADLVLYLGRAAEGAVQVGANGGAGAGEDVDANADVDPDADADAYPEEGRPAFDRARTHRKPVLELRFVGAPAAEPLRTRWHGLAAFEPPRWPETLGPLGPPPAAGQATTEAYAERLKDHSAARASRHRRLFKSAALIILATHVGATTLALLVLELDGSSWLPVLLASEVTLLAIGFGLYQFLQHANSARVWATAQLVAELAVSVRLAGRLRERLVYLLALPFPAELRPLLRTLDVLHLRDAMQVKPRDWTVLRDDYLLQRLAGPQARLGFYRREAASARRGLTATRAAFVTSSLGAIAASALKLLLTVGLLDAEADKPLATLAGALAILLPVFAVAALSLAGAFDLEARAHTFEEMAGFLDRQQQRLAGAASEREFARLVQETESRLLGETLTWYSRRSFTDVA